MGPAGELKQLPQSNWLVRASIALKSAGFALEIAWLLLMAAVVDGVLIRGETLGMLAPLLFAMIALAVASAIAGVSSAPMARSAGNSVASRLRTDVGDKISGLGPDYISRNGSGAISVLATDNAGSIGDYVAQFIPVRTMAVIGPAMVLLGAAVLDLWTVSILVFAGSMLTLLLALIGRNTRDLTDRRQAELTWLGGFYLDMVAGLLTLRANGRAEDATAAIADVSTRHAATTMSVLRSAFQTSLVMEWAATAATALVAVQVSFRLINGHITFGTALAVLVLAPMFFQPLRELAIQYHVGHAAESAAADITELLETESPRPEITRLENTETERTEAASPRAPADGALEFRHVSYGHIGSEKADEALTDLSFTIASGERVALTGPSGVGKSTAASLAVGFIRADSGQILFGGLDIATLDRSAWLDRIAYIPQHPMLFDGTVAANIDLSETGRSIAQIQRAVDEVGGTATLKALPEGLHTEVGERGHRLSGGQRQVVALARAALRDPELIVLDEFTAHLHHETEAQVLTGVEKLTRGRTSLIIAHRPATIAMADRVIALKADRVGGSTP